MFDAHVESTRCYAIDFSCEFEIPGSRNVNMRDGEVHYEYIGMPSTINQTAVITRETDYIMAK